MTTRELIQRLKELDPEGDKVVTIDVGWDKDNKERFSMIEPDLIPATYFMARSLALPQGMDTAYGIVWLEL